MGGLPEGAPTRFDAVLISMGLALLTGIAIGWFSTVPVRVGSAAGSLIAGVALLEGTLWHPPGRSARQDQSS